MKSTIGSRPLILLTATLIVVIGVVLLARLRPEHPKSGAEATSSLIESSGPAWTNRDEPGPAAGDNAKAEAARKQGEVERIAARIASKKWLIPELSDVAGISPDQEGQFLKLLLDEKVLTNKVAYLSIIGSIGGDQSASILIGMIVDDYNGLLFSRAEQNVMGRAIITLGCISVRSRSAADFLEKASHEEFWVENRKWKPADYQTSFDHRTDLVLAGDCLKAMAIGGNELVEKRIATIKDSDLAFQQKWSGTVVEAAFHLDMAKQVPSIPVSLVHPEKTMEKFVRWVASERGKEMNEWYGAVNKIEKSDEKKRILLVLSCINLHLRHNRSPLCVAMPSAKHLRQGRS